MCSPLVVSGAPSELLYLPADLNHPQTKTNKKLNRFIKLSALANYPWNVQGRTTIYSRGLVGYVSIKHSPSDITDFQVFNFCRTYSNFEFSWTLSQRTKCRPNGVIDYQVYFFNL